MDPEKEQKLEEAKPEESLTPDPEGEKVDQKVDDRPAENYRAELERKNREIERIRAELASREAQPRAKDPNDLRTWPDHELKAVLRDSQFAQYHDQVNDILLDRKLDARMAVREETNKRVSAEMQLREKFPDALDPSSDLAVRMEKIIQENDLSKSPAGRLVAAKLASAEINQGKNSSDARGRKIEKDRVASVKSQMVDGDRPKPTQNDSKNLDEKRKDLAEKLTKAGQKGHENASTEAMSEILKDRFGSRDDFFNKNYKK